MRIEVQIDDIRPNWLEISVGGEIRRTMSTFDFGVRVVRYEGSYEELLDAAKDEQRFVLVPMESDE